MSDLTTEEIKAIHQEVEDEMGEGFSDEQINAEIEALNSSVSKSEGLAFALRKGSPRKG